MKAGRGSGSTLCLPQRLMNSGRGSVSALASFKGSLSLVKYHTSQKLVKRFGRSSLDIPQGLVNPCEGFVSTVSLLQSFVKAVRSSESTVSTL